MHAVQVEPRFCGSGRIVLTPVVFRRLRTMRFATAVFLSLLLLPAAASAGPLEDGKAAYDRHDYQTALKLLQPLADQGNAEAQTDIGLMYENGEGVVKDYAEAMKWFRMAADRGNTDAQANVCGLSMDGHDTVPKDYARALQCFHRLADQGDKGAQEYIGMMYENGLGVETNYVEAFFWLSLSGRPGYIGASPEYLAKNI